MDVNFVNSSIFRRNHFKCKFLTFFVGNCEWDEFIDVVYSFFRTDNESRRHYRLNGIFYYLHYVYFFCSGNSRGSSIKAFSYPVRLYKRHLMGPAIINLATQKPTLLCRLHISVDKQLSMLLLMTSRYRNDSFARLIRLHMIRKLAWILKTRAVGRIFRVKSIHTSLSRFNLGTLSKLLTFPKLSKTLAICNC